MVQRVEELRKSECQSVIDWIGATNIVEDTQPERVPTSKVVETEKAL